MAGIDGVHHPTGLVCHLLSLLKSSISRGLEGDSGECDAAEAGNGFECRSHEQVGKWKGGKVCR